MIVCKVYDYSLSVVTCTSSVHIFSITVVPVWSSFLVHCSELLPFSVSTVLRITENSIKLTQYISNSCLTKNQHNQQTFGRVEVVYAVT